MENEIWVGTFREVVAYKKEREKNRLNVLENGYNITPHLDMNAQLFTEPLTMVLKSVGNRVSEIRQDGKKRFLKKDADKVLFDFNLYGVMIQIRFLCVFHFISFEKGIKLTGTNLEINSE